MKKLVWILVPAALAAPAALLFPETGCADTTDCTHLGLCSGTGTGGAGTGGTGTGGKGTGATGTGGKGTGGVGTGGVGMDGGDAAADGAGMDGGDAAADGAGMDGGDAAADGEAGVSSVCLSRRWGDSENQTARALWADGTGNVVLAGDLQGNLNFGGTTSTIGATGMASAFVAVLGANDQGVWSLAVPSQSTYLASAIDGKGNVVLAGTYPPVVPDGGAPDAGAGFDLGCGALDPTKSSFVAMFDKTGACKFSRAFAASPLRASLAVDASGNVVFAGGVTGVADFGCATQQTTAGEDIFVVKLQAGGACAWQKVFGTAKDDEATGVAVDLNGNVFLTGTFQGLLDLGTGGNPLDNMGNTDVFVASLNPAGNTQWATRFDGPDPKSAAGVAVVSDGVIAAGTYSNTLAVGDGGVTSGQPALFAAKLALASGATVWTQTIQGTAVTSLAADPTGRTAYVGASGADVLVARLDATGNLLSSQTLTGTGARQGYGVGFTPGGLALAGSFAGMLAVPGGSLTSAGGNDVFLLGLCP